MIERVLASQKLVGGLRECEMHACFSLELFFFFFFNSLHPLLLLLPSLSCLHETDLPTVSVVGFHY